MNNELIKRIEEMLSSEVSGDAYILLADCRDEIERLSKPYVPMTAQERLKLRMDSDAYIGVDGAMVLAEAYVAKRAGLEVAK